MNPQIGRFVTMDPFAGWKRDPYSLHKYLYANANPITMVDLSGKSPTVVELAYVGTMIGAFAGWQAYNLTHPGDQWSFRGCFVWTGWGAMSGGLFVLWSLPTTAALSGGALTSDIVYRGEAGNAEQKAMKAFEEGLIPHGGRNAIPTVNNLIQSINTSSRAAKSAFVQASEAVGVAKGFATNGGTRPGVLFEIKTGLDSIFVNHGPLLNRILYPEQEIVAFPGGVRPEQIIRALILDKNGNIVKVIENPFL